MLQITHSFRFGDNLLPAHMVYTPNLFLMYQGILTGYILKVYTDFADVENKIFVLGRGGRGVCVKG